MITIDIAIKRFNDNAEHELTLGNLRGCLEFRQLAEWLEKYKKIEQLIADYEEYKWERIDVKDMREIIDGNVD